MAYLDTNVIIGYCFLQDVNHQNAVCVIKQLQGLDVERFYCSPLTLIELYSYISRSIDVLELPLELRNLIRTRELKVRVIAERCFLELPFSITFISDVGNLVDIKVIHSLVNVRMFHKFAEALELAPKLQIPSLDLLHLMYARQVPEHTKYFATLDKAIISKTEVIERVLGIKVIGIPFQFS